MRGDDSHEGFLANEKLDLVGRTRREVDGIVHLLGLASGADVLDCPCGYGRHSIELGRRGFDVVGADINNEHLTAAREAVLRIEKPVTVQFIERDMREIGHTGAFDAIVNMFYSYGFFDEDDENFRVLTGWLDALKPSGKLLIHTDVNVPRIVAGSYRLEETRTLGPSAKLHISETYSHRTRRVNGIWELEDESGKKRLTPYSMRVFTAEELGEWLYDAGFAKVEAFADWNGRPYDTDAEEMMVIATK